MTAENLKNIDASSIVSSLKQNGTDLGELLNESRAFLTRDSIDELQKTLQHAKEALDSQKVHDAQQRLMQVRQQLENLLNSAGKENPDARRALDRLNQVTINDAASADQAGPLLNLGTQVAQEECGEQIQETLMGGLGAIIGGATGFLAGSEAKKAMLAFGKSLGFGSGGHEIEGLARSQQAAQNLLAIGNELTGAALFRETASGISQNAKPGKGEGFALTA